MARTATAGRFVWYDLMTTDQDAAQDFYTHVMGWTVTPWRGPTPYRLWNAGSATVGGLMELPAEMRDSGVPPHWMGYISVPGIEDAVKRATAEGATLLAGPEEVPDTGQLAVLQDPQGAAFAIFTPSGDPMPTPEPPPTGGFSWHELATTDRDAAWAFYHRMFGWTQDEAMDMGGGDLYQLFSVGGRQVGGLFTKPPAMEGPPAWLYYIRVPDMAAALDRVKGRGGQVLNGPSEVPGGDVVAQCVDPQGAVFALHAPAG